MDNETIEIRKVDAVAAYNAAKAANDNGAVSALEAVFGKKLFKPEDVRERVKTFADACGELGENHPLVREWKGQLFSDLPTDVEAYLKLRIIAAALNEGWKPTFGKDEQRYFPWFHIYSKEELEEMDEEERSRAVGRASNYASAYGGLAYASAYYASSYSYTNHGSRLAFKSEELATYCGSQFIDIWADFIC